MKVMTLNLRGLSGKPRWRVLRELVKKEEVDILCLQETKRESIDEKICYNVWGDKEVEW